MSEHLPRDNMRQLPLTVRQLIAEFAWEDDGRVLFSSGYQHWRVHVLSTVREALQDVMWRIWEFRHVETVCVQLERTQPGQMPQKIETGHKFLAEFYPTPGRGLQIECWSVDSHHRTDQLMGGPTHFTKRPKIELVEYWAPDGPRGFVVHQSWYEKMKNPDLELRLAWVHQLENLDTRGYSSQSYHWCDDSSDLCYQNLRRAELEESRKPITYYPQVVMPLRSLQAGSMRDSMELEEQDDSSWSDSEAIDLFGSSSDELEWDTESETQEGED